MRRHLLIGLIGWTVVLLFCVSPYASESAKADGVVLSMTRTAVGGGIYTPCQTLDLQVEVTRSGDGAVTAAGIEETLPAGWTFHSVLPDGSGVPTIVPRPGAEGVLSFAWFDLQGAGIPGFPLSFVYRVNVPCSETGDETVSGLCLYRYLLDNGSSSGEQQTAVQSTVVSLTTEPQTFYVSKQGAAKAAGTHADPFAAIADAVKATVSGRGDTIVVGDGVYRESPVLKRNTTLYGERGAFHTRIVSPSDDAAAIVTAGDGCVVRRLAIGGAGNGSAVLVKDGAQAELTNLVLFANHTGVYASTNANVTFSNNTIYGNTGYGVFSADEAYFDVLMHSLFISNNVGVHITLDAVGEGTHNAYFNNTLHQDGHAPHGTHLFVDPLFVDAALLNFHLKLHSPVRDAGDPDTEHNDVDGSRNDLGADGGPFGVQDTTSPAVVIITNPSPPVVGVDMPIGLDVSGSTDEWGIAAYEWDFEASDVFVPDADTPYIEYRFASPGEHVVKLRVTDHGGLQTMASVTVQVNTYALRLMSPNGGEVWPLGKTVRIAWEDLTGLYTGDVRLSLYGNGIAPHSITQTAGNLGYFDWVIPKNLPPGGGYRVRLESVSHPPLFDVSDGDFVIVAQDNDSLSGAVWIGTDGPPISEQFHYPRDENWYAFCVPPDLVGQQIDMALTFQDPSFDALLELFWDNGAGPIAEAALPIPGNPERRIAWTPIEAGCYRIRVVGVDSSLYGPRTSHTLRVWHPSGTVAAGAIGGLVRDAVTWAPISGARVTADFAGLTALTTPAGAYRFEALPQGTYTLSVEAPGYLAGTRQVVLASGAIETANFDLPSLAAVPPPQEVSASDGTFAGQVRVTWRSVPWATGYRVFRDGVALNACTFIEFIDDRPESSAVHLYQVQTCYPGGSSELSAPDTGYRAGVPDYPVWVLASNGDFADRVRVSWAPVPGASYYRVYRFGPEQTPVDGDIEAAVEQMQPSLEDAAPVGDWTAATWMDDTSAEVPATRWSCRGDEAVYNVYLYAVVAGNTAGESLPSVWNEGYVGSETAEGESVYEPVLPSRPVTGSKRAALPESELALRLVSSDTIDADSVWGQVVCAAFEDDQVEWRPLQANDGWVVYRPTEPWRPGDSVTMTAGALTSDGAVVGPVSYEFIIEAADPGNAKAEVWQPSDADFDSTGMDAEIPAELEVAPPDTVLLPGAVSPLYRIAPDGLYDAPRRVWLPVPNGIINPVHALRYGVQTDAGTAWHPATAVAGWLVEGSALELNLRGGRYLGILARHGAIVGFVEPSAPVTAASLSLPARNGGDWLLIAVTMLLLVSMRSGLRLRMPSRQWAALLVLCVAVSGCPRPITQVGEGPAMAQPVALGVGADEALFVVDRLGAAVVQVNPETGNRVIVSNADVGSGPVLLEPVAIAVAPSGNLFVVDAERAAVVWVQARSGERLILSGADQGDGPVLEHPVGVAVVNDDLLAVADAGRLTVFHVNRGSGARTVVSDAQTGQGPMWTSCDAVSVATNGGLLVTSSTDASVFLVNPATGDRSVLASNDTGAGPPLIEPRMAMPGSGNTVIVFDKATGGIVRVDTVSKHREVVADSGTDEALRYASGLAVEPGGTFAVAAGALGAVLRVNGTGAVRVLSDADTSSQSFYDRPGPVATVPGCGWVVADIGLGALVHVAHDTGKQEVLSDPDTGDGTPFDQIADICMGADGSLMAVDFSMQAVLRVDLSTGNRNVLSSDQTGSGPSLLQPMGIALDAAGQLIVTGFGGTLWRVDPAAGHRTLISGPDLGAGAPFIGPCGVAVTASGSILAADPVAQTLVEVDPLTGDRTVLSGGQIGSGPLWVFPRDVALDMTGRIVVLDSAIAALFVVDAETGERTVLSDAVTGTGPAFSAPHALAVACDGALMVTDTERGVLFLVDPATGNRQFAAIP